MTFLITLNIFHTFSGVSAVEFEQANACCLVFYVFKIVFSQTPTTRKQDEICWHQTFLEVLTFYEWIWDGDGDGKTMDVFPSQKDIQSQTIFETYI